MSKSTNRRKFIKSTTGLLALAALDLSNLNCAATHDPLPMPRAPRGPNERLNVAIIGLGRRSQSHLSAYSARNNCQITHICDPDSAKAEQALTRARTSNGGADAQFVTDLRRVLDDRSVDLVSIVTPNHWHALASIWAMHAGKDVCVEKPISHNFPEGRLIVQAAERTQRVCQVGTQMRSNPAIIEAMAYIHDGNLGKVLISRALCYKARPSTGKVAAPLQPPSTLDYDLWCGPAPLAPITRTEFHYDWHWNWDFGNGDLGNQGVHELDIARWAINANTLPKSVQSVGGRFGYIDDGQTANTQIATFDYGEGQPRLIAEVRGLQTRPFHTAGVENVIECEKGFLVSPSYTSAVAYDRDGTVLRRFTGGNEQNLFNNFLGVVRSRRIADLHAPAIEGHHSAALMHLANISYRLGKATPLDPKHADIFASDPVANESMQKMIQHLADNKIPMETTTYSQGPRLIINTKKESIENSAAANRMLTREYRKPFQLTT